MASTDARPQPLKNTALRVYFPIYDADGDLVSGAAGLDSEISKDGGTFADCTNEATEIASASGTYYLDLTSTEMNADAVVIIVKTTTTGAKTTPIFLYPVEATDIPVNVTAWNGTAVATPDTAGYPKVTLKSGTGTGEINLTSGRADANTTYIAGSAVSTSSAQLGVNVVNAGGTAWGSGAITAGSIAADAIGASELATDAVTEIVSAVWAAASRTLTANTNLNDPSAATIADAVWDEARSGHTSAGTFGEGVVVSSIATAAITAAAIAADAIGASELAADAASEIATAVWAAVTRTLTANTNLNDPSAAAIADAVWDEARSGHTSAGTFGEGVVVSSIATAAITAAAIAADAIGASELAADAASEIATAVWAAVTRTLTANTNLNDPSAAAIADAVWDEARSGHTSAGTFGEGVVVSSIATAAITAAAIAADAIGASELATDAVTEIVNAVWAAASRTLTANTNLNDPSAATIADAVWDEARSGHTSAGTFGQGVATVQGNVTGSVGSVASGGITAASFAADAITSSVLAASAVTEIQTGLSTLSAAQVNAEVVDALATDTYAEPSSVPAATASLAAKIGFLMAALRNKHTTTASADAIRNDADSAAIATAALTDDGTTFTRGEYA